MKNPLNILLVTIEGGGNIPPVLGLAHRLAQRGHRVRVLTEPCLKEAVEAYGLEFVPFQQHFTRKNRTEDIFEDWKATPFSNPAFDIIFGSAAIVAEETHTHLQKETTDILLADTMMPGSLLAAEALGVPRAVLFHMPEYMPGSNRPPGGMGLLPGKGVLGQMRDRLLGSVFHRVMNKYLPKLNAVREMYGLSRLQNTADMLHQADLRIIQTSQHFDFPLEPLPANVRYVGPVLDDPDWVDAWESPWSPDDPRPLVVVSLSSTFQNQKNVIERCIQALGTMDVRGLVTLGPAMAEEEFTQPDNVVVVTNVPHSVIFPWASVVVTHAGHGTVMRSLANGVPLVCLPMGRDQGDNAAKVAYHGAGIRLNAKAKAETIRKAVERVLRESSYRKNAERLKAHILTDAQQDTAVEAIESLAVNRTTSKLEI